MLRSRPLLQVLSEQGWFSSVCCPYGTCDRVFAILHGSGQRPTSR
jgi:hypothetical protein